MSEAIDPAGPSTGGSLRERKREAAKARVVDAALALFAERGYGEVSVDEICAAADVAPRSFFRYFPAKADVLFEPVRVMSDVLEAGIVAAPAGLDDDAVVAFGLRRLAEHVIDRREPLAGFFRVAAETEEFRASPLVQLSHRERAVAEHLLARRGIPGPPDWRARLRVARAVAAFRVWLDDVRTLDVPDPLAHLDELLTAG